MVTDLIRLSGPSEISIFSLTPPTSLNPLPPKSESDPSSDLRATSEALGLHTPASKVRSESTIRGLFLGPSKRFGTGAADVDPLAGGLGVWVGEYKGQPASVNLYTLRSLRDVGNGALPVTQARKSFFKGDKVVLKWNKVGSMVSLYLGRTPSWAECSDVRVDENSGRRCHLCYACKIGQANRYTWDCV
jgi:hypothetical protein